MVFFFLLVGLEIKRELLEGHLSTPRCAALPAFAAVGGMVVPAAIYAGFNWTDPVALRGWAIPTATDIVLALGMLSLLGSRVPVSLRVFLTALAIFDDIGAVLIIGVFYAEEISLAPLVVAALALGGLAVLNVFRVARSALYIALGLVIWVAMLKAGAEAALAGVLIALVVPLRASSVHEASPLRTVERRLHPWVVLGVVPLFAFFNAGVVVDRDVFGLLFSPVSVGVAAGLFLGKQVGVLGASWIAVRLGLGQLPAGVNWGQVYGAAILAGIGFTMSLFIASLAFDDPAMAAATKLVILGGSAVSAAAGLAVLGMATRRRVLSTTKPGGDRRFAPVASRGQPLQRITRLRQGRVSLVQIEQTPLIGHNALQSPLRAMESRQTTEGKRFFRVSGWPPHSRAELAYTLESTAAKTAVAENYVGLPY